MEQKSKLPQEETIMEISASRRSLLKGLAIGAGTIGAGLLNTDLLTTTFAHAQGPGPAITKGDVAILRFLAAAELLESDLWQQYNELAGIQDKEVPGGTGNPVYTKAVQFLDSDMAQYIHDNTDDEFSHAAFINAYLMAHGAEPVSLKQFRTLPSSKATGAQQIGRLTNLMQLSVDTTYWTRYRSSTKNPDLGDTFMPAIPDLLKGQFPAIPRDDSDLTPHDHIQAIGNTAGFHFAFIEQGGTSLYAALAQRVSSVEVLRILLSIGATEVAHFQTWHDKAGNFKVLTDPTNGLNFPDLNASHSQATQTNLIMPEPTIFLNRKFPPVSIIRPTETEGAAMGAVKALTDDGLFIGQSKAFFAYITELAMQADAAQRGV
ncbi:MAG TPA: ferritin-like domain-containing protein [Ktedonobacteraceae bacterium]|nr:ferritin-like domain-containing protein [Ktedonobacteraceae bacterium]